MRLLLVITLALALPSACADRAATIHVGYKQFAEQLILAEALARMVQDHGELRASTRPCGDTYGCYRDLQQGRVDLMVDYSGTGLAFLGRAHAPGEASLKTVRALFKPLGLRWLGPLGFDNSYRLLVRAQRPQRSIADLARLEGGVRVACPPEYLRRPQDGLAALVKRYGLRLRGEPVQLREPGERFQTLFDGRADVAVGYATDGAISRLGLRVLQDPLRFFPPYEAAVLARADVLRDEPALARALTRLERRLSTETMRALNYKVQVEGRQPAQVALGFLRREKLLRGEAGQDKARVEMTLALHGGDPLGPSLVTRATRAVRRAFPGRAVAARVCADPVAMVAQGRARLALLGAERFFSGEGAGPPRREARVEALAVVATRMLHVLRRAKSCGTPLSGRAGVSDRALSALVKRAAHDRPRQLVQQLAAGKLDVALILTVPGDPRVAGALKGARIELCSLPRLAPGQALRLPFLRPARIPAGRYAGQAELVETLAAQVVLAGPAGGSSSTGSGGPAAAVPSGHHFSRVQVEALARATRVAEAPDPILPSAWGVRAARREGVGTDETGADVVDTVLNVLAVAFLIWLVAVVVRRRQ